MAAVHGIRAAMASLKKTGTDFTSAKGMDPKAFFEVMGTQLRIRSSPIRTYSLLFLVCLAGLNAVVTLDAQAGGKAFEEV